tara:strand:- start:1259 stop:1417 length:159 start_codon:yes stop_codon:yes gene_type:complete
MKTIHTIIEGFSSILGLKSTKKTPQLIAVNQESFCHNMAITDYYCDESNLFI